MVITLKDCAYFSPQRETDFLMVIVLIINGDQWSSMVVNGGHGDALGESKHGCLEQFIVAGEGGIGFHLLFSS